MMENAAAVIALLLTLEIARMCVADIIKGELEAHRALVAAAVLFISNGCGRTRYQRILPLKRRTRGGCSCSACSMPAPY